MNSDPNIRHIIRDQVLSEGFDAVGFADPKIGNQNAEHLSKFLDKGFHGDMGWLKSNAEKRKSPIKLWPEVKTVIAVGANYGPDHLPHERLQALKQASKGNISVYARNQDYHVTLKKRLKRIGHWICNSFGGDVKIFVDTAPVLEKPIAQLAGIGWQGKHSNLVSRDFGSWLFLGEIYSTLLLRPDDASQDFCGSCQKCLDICPTNAFPRPYQLDARKCISYLTIEHKGHIPRKYRQAIGTRIFGCDDCLSICPWNKFARLTTENDFVPRKSLSEPLLSELLQLDDVEFRHQFKNSPLKRLGRNRFIRNSLIAAANTGDNSLSNYVIQHLNDPSPIVRAMAVWAISKLVDKSTLYALKSKYKPRENDPFVLSEWRIKNTL